MVSSCGAYGCTNRGEEKAKDKKKIEKNDKTPNGQKHEATMIKPKKTLSFHSLPKNTNLREQWERNIRREGKLPKSLVLCSEHFESSCFERDLQVNACLLPFSYPKKWDSCMYRISLYLQ